MNTRLIASGFITLAIVGSVAAGPVMADAKLFGGSFGYGYGYRPGWGFGDKNHIHIGPPGLVEKEEGHGNPHGTPPGQTNDNREEQTVEENTGVNPVPADVEQEADQGAVTDGDTGEPASPEAEADEDQPNEPARGKSGQNNGKGHGQGKGNQGGNGNGKNR